MEFNILVPFIIIANIAFVVIIMCIVLMMDVKLRLMSGNLTKIVGLMESLVKNTSDKKE